MDFNRFSNLENVYVWDEEDKILEKFIDYLKWETSKDEDETQDEYEDRADYYLKYENVFDTGESILNFCLSESEVLGQVLKEVDVFEIYEKDFSFSEVSLRHTGLIQPLREWFYTDYKRILRIPFIAETYADEVKAVIAEDERNKEFRRKRRALWKQESTESTESEEPFVEAMAKAYEEIMPNELSGLFEDGELDSIMDDLVEKELEEELKNQK
ncbi:hypothetical protein H5404_18155 [Vibrio parahaemolyticus]|uniref:hypothetical protein n=1 Tax=Vibrio parahaemolyticus TaxID=670 RepID=UPI001626C8F0|nr:hypothetical protein [Vibrio parahaemolyticus]QNE57745.1 hypothetical protein H5404_18155 [Vibrio parahaemolyticus]